MFRVFRPVFFGDVVLAFPSGTIDHGDAITFGPAAKTAAESTGQRRDRGTFSLQLPPPPRHLVAVGLDAGLGKDCSDILVAESLWAW